MKSISVLFLSNCDCDLADLMQWHKIICKKAYASDSMIGKANYYHTWQNIKSVLLYRLKDCWRGIQGLFHEKEVGIERRDRKWTQILKWNVEAWK